MTDPGSRPRIGWIARRQRAAVREVALTLRRGLPPVAAILAAWTVVAVGQTPTGLRSPGELLGAASTLGVASVLASVLAYTWVASRAVMPPAWDRLQQGAGLTVWLGEWAALLIGAAMVHLAAVIIIFTVYRILLPDHGPGGAFGGLVVTDLAALSPVFAAGSMLARVRLPGWLSAATWCLLTALALHILPGAWPVAAGDPAGRALAGGAVATVAVWCAALGVAAVARGVARS